MNMQDFVDNVIGPLNNSLQKVADIESFHQLVHRHGSTYTIPHHDIEITYGYEFSREPTPYVERIIFIIEKENFPGTTLYTTIKSIAIYDREKKIALGGKAYEYMVKHVMRAINSGSGHAGLSEACVSARNQIRTAFETGAKFPSLDWTDAAPRKKMFNSIDSAIDAFAKGNVNVLDEDSKQMIAWLLELKKSRDLAVQEKQREEKRSDPPPRSPDASTHNQNGRRDGYSPSDRPFPNYAPPYVPPARDSMERRWGSHLEEARRLDWEDAKRERILRGDY